MMRIFMFVYILISSIELASTSSRPPTTTQRTTIPPFPPDGCEHEGRFYANGERIEWDEMYGCYGTVCIDGGVAYFDHACFFHNPCPGEFEKVLGQCCPLCLNTTTTPPTTVPTTPITTPPGGCVYDGITYKDGEDISTDYYNCGGLICEGGQLLAWDHRCAFITPYCAGDSYREKGKCCPVCINGTTTTPYPTTPEIPGCDVDGVFYKHGQRIHVDQNNCSGSECQYGVVHSWERGCAYPPTLCPGEYRRVPGQCCLVCFNVTTSTPEVTTPEVTTPEATCTIRNRKYSLGQVTNNDPCHVCKCTVNGTEACDDVICDEVLDCDVTYWSPDACCYTCGCDRIFMGLFTMLVLLFVSEEFQPL